jgi:hypothetical protein
VNHILHTDNTGNTEVLSIPKISNTIGDMPEGKQYVNLLFEEKLLARVDDFRFRQRFTTRAEAIRWLITAALDAKLKPEGE